MGWDAFGLPAENHAIATGQHPRDVTKKNVANFRRQIKALGFSYDWDREVDTTDPAYYKWTQWIFLQLYKKGLAYEGREPHQLLSGLPDRVGQRGSAPGRLRAVRHPCGTARHAPMAVENHGLRRSLVGGSGRVGLAGVHVGHAEKLDRPIGRGGSGF
jgi:hypothetical protein